MFLNEYQEQAARTINKELPPEGMERHALHLMAAECGEIHGLFQKTYQGHGFESEHLKKEVGDLLWGIAELCTANGWKLEEVARMNIDKLRARYPEGFSSERSLNRSEGDV